MNTKKLFYWSITVAMAGFLFGFDTVVISGADQSLQELWNKGELFHGFVIISSALWGTVIGAIFGGIPTEQLGRKKTLIWIGAFFLISALGSAMSSDPWVFSAFRFLGGLGVGASTVAAPTYIAEIAPAEKRGKLVALYQFNIVFGIMVAYLSNFLLSGIETDAWRWMIGIEAVPALIYSLLVLGVPESPRWLISRKKDETTALGVLKVTLSDQQAKEQVEIIKSNLGTSPKDESIYQSKYRFPLKLAFLIAFFNQFSGINAFLYFAPRIFEIAGLGEESALLSSVGIGVVNILFTYLGLSLIDKTGRRNLMYYGSIGYIISLSLVAVAFMQGWQGISIPIFFFLFIAAHGIGQGTVIWVFISEIFPNHLRADGQAFGSSVHWVLAAAIPSMIPFLFSSIGASTVFFIFAFMMVLQLLFVWKMMPETKGVSLEELQKKLVNK
ncbi:MAG: sugar porter (SP) family MFS transporter [Arcticibacterium sp.]|jgi:sugar porter (SP) family MFS transporter